MPHPGVPAEQSDVQAAHDTFTTAQQVAEMAADNTRQARRELDQARGAYEAACDAEADAYLRMDQARALEVQALDAAQLSRTATGYTPRHSS